MMVIGAVTALVLVGGGGLLALQAFTAVSQAPAASMPPETGAYLSVDLLQLTGEDTTGALIDTVNGILTQLGEDVAEPEDLIADLDEQLWASAGFDFSNDIRPWIGRTIGLGVLPSGWDPMDYTSTPDVLLAVEVRNDGKARDFLETLQASLARDGFAIVPSTYRGVDLLNWRDAGTGVTIAVSDGMLLAGTTIAVQRGVDAQNGSSLADHPGFVAATESLPDSRLLTGWINGGFYRDIYESMLTTVGGIMLDASLSRDMLDGWENASFSVTVTDTGVAFDGALMLTDGGPEWYTPELLGTGSVPALLPVDTLAFAEYGSPAGLWSSIAASVVGQESAYEEELDAAAAELGFHPIDDFVAHLDGVLGVALLRSEEGQLAAESGYPVGLVGFAGTSSPDPLRATLVILQDVLEEKNTPVSAATVGGNEIYVLEDDAAEVVTYGVTDERFVVGTSSSDLTRIGAAGPNLLDSAAYAAAVDALPDENYLVSFFADVDGLADVFGASGDAQIALEPFTAVIAATSIDGDTYRGTVLVLIDYE